MSEYTPSTEDVKAAYDSFMIEFREDYTGDKQFDRWLAEHDAEVVARTLAAQYTGGVCQLFDTDLEWRDWVKDAERLIKGESG